MQVIQIFSMNQQIQHVITLSTYLKAHFDPIQSSRLEKFGGFERSEQISFLLRLWRSVMQSVQNIIFQQFLIAHPDFNGLTRRAMFSVPCFDQWNIQCLKNYIKNFNLTKNIFSRLSSEATLYPILFFFLSSSSFFRRGFF